MSVDLREALEEHRRGNLERAAGIYEAALADEPDHPDALHLLGVVKLQQGDPVEAVRLMGRAVVLQPTEAGMHVNLGDAYRAVGDFNRAIHCCQTALRLDPHMANARGKLALAHQDMGNALQTQGRLEEARDSLLEALRLDPASAATHAAIAHVWEQLGEFEQMLAALRETLRREPRHSWALARLATRLRDELSEADQAVIESLLADSQLANEPRTELLFGLAQALDARGEFDRVAGLSDEANSLQRESFRERGLAYDHAAHRRFVDRLIVEFTPHFFDRVRGFGMETQRPVFIVGLPRSGTSLTEQILASHPRVFGAGELKLARQVFERLPGAIAQGGMPFDALPSLERDTVLELAHHYSRELTALNASADRVVDKMPDNSVYLGLIATVFPRATLIHCRRDVRDVALSCWMTNFMQVRWACDPDQIARRIDEHQRLMEHWRRVLPMPMHEVDYEELVADLEKGARALVAGCGLEWDPACLEFYKTRRPVRTSSAQQVRQPIYASSVGRWRHYEQSLAPLFARLKVGR